MSRFTRRRDVEGRLLEGLAAWSASGPHAAMPGQADAGAHCRDPHHVALARLSPIVADRTFVAVSAEVQRGAVVAARRPSVAEEARA
jgi:hypothetical protein